MSATSATLLLVALWLAIGACTGLAIARRGLPLTTAATAVAAWPVLLPLLADPVATVLPGPHTTRIVTTFGALDAALREPAARDVVGREAIDRLRLALHRADARIAMVDRMLQDDVVAADPASAPLVEARARAAAEVDAVLRGVVQLRVQVGLLALAGDTAPARDQVGELLARVRALEEITLTPATVPCT